MNCASEILDGSLYALFWMYQVAHIVIDILHCSFLRSQTLLSMKLDIYLSKQHSLLRYCTTRIRFIGHQWIWAITTPTTLDRCVTYSNQAILCFTFFCLLCEHWGTQAPTEVGGRPANFSSTGMQTYMCCIVLDESKTKDKKKREREISNQIITKSLYIYICIFGNILEKIK